MDSKRLRAKHSLNYGIKASRRYPHLHLSWPLTQLDMFSKKSTEPISTNEPERSSMPDNTTSMSMSERERFMIDSPSIRLCRSSQASQKNTSKNSELTYIQAIQLSLAAFHQSPRVTTINKFRSLTQRYSRRCKTDGRKKPGTNYMIKLRNALRSGKKSR